MATKKATKKETTKRATKRMAIVCSQWRDLYYGEVVEHDAKAQTATVVGCRHVVYWKCAVKGGLTSLAVHGPTSESRIAAPCERSALSGVAAVHDCSPEAQQAFAAVRS